MSPEVQNKGISSRTKRNDFLQIYLKKKQMVADKDDAVMKRTDLYKIHAAVSATTPNIAQIRNGANMIGKAAATKTIDQNITISIRDFALQNHLR